MQIQAARSSYLESAVKFVKSPALARVGMTAPVWVDTNFNWTSYHVLQTVSYICIKHNFILISVFLVTT